MKVNIDTGDKLYAEAWQGFNGTDWKESINVRDFIQHNYTPYEGDESFLAEATSATLALWEKGRGVCELTRRFPLTLSRRERGFFRRPAGFRIGS